MGTVLVVCAVLVAGSLLALLLYVAVFVVAAVVTLRTRRRPDPVVASLDRFLAELLEGAGAGAGGRMHGRASGPSNR